MNQDQALADLHRDLRLKRLNRTWAKLEILFGLLAAGLGVWFLSRPEVQWEYLAGGLALFVLGGYLALAGSPSHVYQSNNELAAYLAARMGAGGPPPA